MAHMERIWGARSGHSREIVENVIQYLKEHPANYQGQVDTLLELLYQAFTEYNSAETPEFKEQVSATSCAWPSCMPWGIFTNIGRRRTIIA